MAESSVLDTSVLIGLSIENDQHHKNCYQHVVNCDGDCWVTPTARSEYEDLAPEIRNQLNDEIIQHRQRVQQEVGGDVLQRDELEWIRDNLIANNPRKSKSFTYLYEWYNDLMTQRFEIHLAELIERLSNMETEPLEDAAAEHGGWDRLVQFWNRGSDRYPSVKENLLPTGNDKEICIEGHHIAVIKGGIVNLASADSDHCGKKDTESESREENIERTTKLNSVIDLRYPLRPN